MQYLDNRVKEVKIAYIGGGSRGWAWKFMADLALEPDLSGRVDLYDLNYEAACDNELIGNKISTRMDAVGKWEYHAVRTLPEAITGADFIIISILPGTFQEMASDVHCPERYGIYQAVGDTVGPGGLFRALRTIPIYADFASQIEKHAPNAWVINYTNPMSLCTRTLYEVFPKIKAFGCCHEVFSTQRLLARVLKDQLGMDEPPREEIRINVLGINHFTWIDYASYREIDLFPLYRQFVEKYYESGIDGRGLSTNFISAQRVKFDLFRRYGLIAAAGDRHLAEFLPSVWYLKDPETVRFWKFDLTKVDWRIKRQQELAEKQQRMLKGEEEIRLAPSGEEGVRQIKALLGLEELVTNVNLPNRGQMPGMPLRSVIETNAHFTRDKIRPLLAGELPSEIQHLVSRHVWNQETILRAALTKDKELAFKAFLNDPLITLDFHSARELFEQMLVNIRNYLPGWSI